LLLLLTKTAQVVDTEMYDTSRDTVAVTKHVNDLKRSSESTGALQELKDLSQEKLLNATDADFDKWTGISNQLPETRAEGDENRDAAKFDISEQMQVLLDHADDLWGPSQKDEEKSKRLCQVLDLAAGWKATERFTMSSTISNAVDAFSASSSLAEKLSGLEKLEGDTLLVKLKTDMGAAGAAAFPALRALSVEKDAAEKARSKLQQSDQDKYPSALKAVDKGAEKMEEVAGVLLPDMQAGSKLAREKMEIVLRTTVEAGKRWHGEYEGTDYYELVDVAKKTISD
jgi:hypothetical protein